MANSPGSAPRGLPENRPAPPRMLNLPLIAVTIVVVIGLGIGLVVSHNRQLDKLTATLLDVASEVEGKDWPKALQLLQQYHALVPEDMEAAERLAFAIEQTSSSRAQLTLASELYAQVLNQHPENDDVRLRLAELQLELVPPESVLKTLEPLLTREPGHPGALHVKARATEGLLYEHAATLLDVFTAYTDALEADPGNVELAHRIARMCREQAEELEKQDSFLTKSQLESRSTRIINQMVEANPDSPAAYLARAVFSQRFGVGGRDEITRNRQDLDKAVSLGPDDPDTLLRTASFLIDQLRSAQDQNDAKKQELVTLARQLLEHTIEILPKDPRGYRGLAVLLLTQSDFQGAQQSIESGLEKINRHEPTLLLTLAEVKIAAGSWKSAKDVLDVLDAELESRRNRVSDPTEIDQLISSVSLLRAQWFLGESNPDRNLVSGASELESLSKKFKSSSISPLLLIEVARCYEDMGEWDRAAVILEEATSYSREHPDAVMSSAVDWSKARQYRRASGILESIVNADSGMEQSGRAWFELAKAQLGLQMQRREEEQDWALYEKAINNAMQGAGTAASPVLLLLKGKLLRKQFATHADLAGEISQLAETHGKNPAFHRGCFDLWFVLGNQENSRKSFQQLLAIPGETDPARQLLLDGTDPGDTRLEADQLKDYVELSAQRADHLLRSGDVTAATTLLNNAEKLAGDDPRIVTGQARLALQIGDLENLSRRIEMLRNREGSGGSLWRFFEVQRLLATGTPKDLDLAEKLARELQRLRVDWGDGLHLVARVEETVGNWESAAGLYRAAYLAGQRDPEMFSRLICLLLLQQRDVEAKDLLLTAPQYLLFDRRVFSMLAWIKIPDRKLREIEQTLQTRLTGKGNTRVDSLLLLSYSHLISQLAPAEKTPADRVLGILDSTLPLETTNFRSLLATLFFHNKFNTNSDSQNLLLMMRRLSETLAKVPLDAKEPLLAYVVAVGFEMQGKLLDAEKYYRFAGTHPEWKTLEQAGLTKAPLFTLTRKVPDIALSESRLQFAPEDLQRMVGTVLEIWSIHEPTVHGDFLEKHTRLSQLLKITKGGPENLRQATEALRKAVESQPRLSDLLLLAKLYRMLATVKDELWALDQASKSFPSPATHLRLGKRAIEAGDIERAQDALARMDETNPVVVARLGIGLASLRGETAKAVEIAKSYCSDLTGGEEAILGRVNEAATWLAEVELTAEAAQLLQSATEKTKQNTLLAQANLLLKTRDTADQALALLSNTQLPAVTAGWLAALASQQGVLDDSQTLQAEALISRALESDGSRADLVGLVAILREHQGRFDESLALSRQAVELSGRDPRQLNNLAWQLAVHHNGLAEAKQCILEALQQLPADASLLDTLAVIQLAEGKPEVARRTLEGVLLSDNPPDSAYLHLAEAYEMLGFRGEWRPLLEKLAGHNLVNPRDLKAKRSLEELL